MSMLRDVSRAFASSTSKIGKRASILAAIAWGIRIRVLQKRLSSTNML